ncbi:uncharacterized protein UV8b_03497 [Ustilaginoidea virens]|uniref:Uncharacterized protein n=1 Tax=Ustilaginoidea virens TaxID=1159556 RepID=A0A063C7E4_USTVR|nr:uncharacterized protein UV8b_03497 [Ustilaginoidea virens]QUC19256.1 hypothetical protein UV8b_03497 [Ustilaginoidea virens]GAO13109.1 hypothetical protein UVI_02024680 [Ustilaginoidea virens]
MAELSDPALQVIVLGSGGGPEESNVTALLVRSVAENWSKGSIVAVDAGVHLSAVARLVQEAYPDVLPAKPPFTLTRGPFAGLDLPHASASANAAHITRSLVDTYLITHPHLDHISGFVVNTAGLPGTRPKKLAGLPSTIQALKNHVFNNVIWPNLSDENNGAGLITYLRLVEGGSPALGNGPGKGYVEVCDGLLVKALGVSHGHCIERHSHRGSASGASPRFGSHDASSQTPRRDLHSHVGSQLATRGQALLLSQAALSTAAAAAVSSSPSPSPQFGGSGGELDKYCVYDSSAYFIQDQSHRREVLIFGDVEPDSISLNPRNLGVWQEAAPKIAAGTLTALFIECSYDDSQSNDRLFGHLKPCFIMEEMQVLADEVDSARRLLRASDTRKRKRPNLDDDAADAAAVSPKSAKPTASRPAGSAAEHGAHTPHLATPTDELSLPEALELARPLQGLKVVIIHVKERLDDGPCVGDSILQQLKEHEAKANLGCEFVISKSGMSFYF